MRPLGGRRRCLGRTRARGVKIARKLQKTPPPLLHEQHTKQSINLGTNAPKSSQRKKQSKQLNPRPRYRYRHPWRRLATLRGWRRPTSPRWGELRVFTICWGWVGARKGATIAGAERGASTKFGCVFHARARSAFSHPSTTTQPPPLPSTQPPQSGRPPPAASRASTTCARRAWTTTRPSSAPRAPRRRRAAPRVSSRRGPPPRASPSCLRARSRSTCGSTERLGGSTRLAGVDGRGSECDCRC